MTNSQTLGRELARKCDKKHEHQPLLDGRAKDAARYPPALCRAICRGISKEKMQRACGLAVLCSIEEGTHITSIDPEEHHERDEVDIEALIRKIEGEADREAHEERPQAQCGSDCTRPNCRGCVARPLYRQGGLAQEFAPRPGSPVPLRRLMEYRNKQGDISSSLAWDDLTQMKLDAGKVKEARAKDVGYIRDKRVYDKIPRAQAARNSGRWCRPSGSISIKGTMRTPIIEAGSWVRSSIMSLRRAYSQGPHH